MLSLHVIAIVILNLIHNSLTDKCPLRNVCICSSDFTSITCTNSKLTDESLVNLNVDLPKATIHLNLSSNSLTSIDSLVTLDRLQVLDVSHNRIQELPSNLFKRFRQLSSLYVSNNLLKTIPKSYDKMSNVNLDISNNPLSCTCQSKWLVEWFETINLLNRINCQTGKRLNENDFCSSRRNFIGIKPEQSQIAYENDSFLLNCSSNTNVYWTLNDNFYSTNSTVFIASLQSNHSGLWTCHSLTLNRTTSLHVLSVESNYFCPSLQMETSKGRFHWSRTLNGLTIQLKCPFGPAAWFRHQNKSANAFYKCSFNRQWVELDLSQCAFRTNVSRDLDDLISKNSSNLVPRLVEYLSKTNLDQIQFDDLGFLIDLIDEEKDKSLRLNKNIESLSTSIYHLSDLILQIDPNSVLIRQCKFALDKLRSVLEQLLNVMPFTWIYAGKQLTSISLQSSSSPTVCFVPNKSTLRVTCGISGLVYKYDESRFATIKIATSANLNVNQSSAFRIIFYRQSTLFIGHQRNFHNPVIYIKSAIPIETPPTVSITFHHRTSQASVAVWNSNRMLWEMRTSVCQLNRQIDESADCILRSNSSLSVTPWKQIEENEHLSGTRSYLDLAINVTSAIASLCFLICFLFYACCHRVYLMPRSFFHCLINYWLSLVMIFPLFAFGIKQTEPILLCQCVSVGLHYLSLTTIIWLTLLSYCVWQKLYRIWTGKGHDSDETEKPRSSGSIVDYDDDGLPIVKLKAKPVIQFYFLSYGIAFIICGINVAISRDQYMSDQLCFLNNFESLLTLLIPVGIFMFLLLIFLLCAHVNIKRLRKEAIRLRDVPDEPEVEVDTNENIFALKTNEHLPIIIPSNELNGNTMRPDDGCRQSHLDSLCSSDMDHQHQPSNQLLSIVFQLFLLVLIFSSAVSLHVRPFKSLNIRLEHSIYNHCYGFFALILTFYVLAFYVLSRSDLTMHFHHNYCYRKRHRNRQLLSQSDDEPPPPPQTPQQSPSSLSNRLGSLNEENQEKVLFNDKFTGDGVPPEPIPSPPFPHSVHSPTVHQSSQMPLHGSDSSTVNSLHPYGSKRQATVASKYYARHRHLLRTNVSMGDASSQPSSSYIQTEENGFIEDKTIEQDPATEASKMLQQKQHFKETKSVENENTRLDSRCASTAQSVINGLNTSLSARPDASPPKAIIRPLPIAHVSSPKTAQNDPTNSIDSVDTGRNSYRVMPSPSTKERRATYVYLNKCRDLIQQEGSSLWRRPMTEDHRHSHVAFIDDDDEVSLSLKSSNRQSATDSSSSATSPVQSRKDPLQTLSSYSSSSSDVFDQDSNDINQIVLHESSV